MLRRFSLVLLLLSLFSFCVHVAPALEITEEELAQLETILIQSREELQKSKEEVQRLESISTELQTELTTLSTSFDEYVSEAEQIQAELRRDLERKRLAISIGLGIIAAESLVIAFLVFMK